MDPKMWLRDSMASYARSLDVLDRTQGPGRGGEAGVDVGAALVEMEGLGDAAAPACPPAVALRMDALAAQVASSAHGALGAQTLSAGVLERCRRPLCLLYVMTLAREWGALSVFIKKTKRREGGCDGWFSVSVPVVGVSRESVLIGCTDPWRAVRQRMLAMELPGLVACLEAASAASGRPVIEPADVFEAIQLHRTPPAPVKTAYTHGMGREDSCVIGVHCALLDAVRSGACRSADSRPVFRVFLQEYVSSHDGDFQAWNEQEDITIAIPGGIIDMGHASSNAMGDGHVGGAGWPFGDYHERHCARSVTPREAGGILTLARDVLARGVRDAGGAPDGPGDVSWAWDRVSVDVGISMRWNGILAIDRVFTNSARCSRALAFERGMVEMKGRDLRRECAWKMSYLRAVHEAFTVDGVVETVAEMYARDAGLPWFGAGEAASMGLGVGAAESLPAWASRGSIGWS